MELVIKAELAQQIIDYLVPRPYGEVAGMIQGIQQLQPVPVLEEVPDEKEDEPAPRNRKERRAEEAAKK